MSLEITESNFETEVLNAGKPVLLDFWAEWCGPCRMITPLIDQLASELADIAVIAKVNVDKEPSLASRFGVRTIPTLVFLKNGAVVDTVIGAGTSKDALAAKLRALV